MYLNFSNFWGRTSAGGGTSLGPKTGTSGGGLAKISPDGGPPSPPQEKTLMCLNVFSILSSILCLTAILHFVVFT